ncbi:hypothetical protein [Clostridium sp.]|jgi:putative GTP pyrophosphokinase|uniref:hypothetical protein n=1 Tax=Clostridium sp. TaxID=1506 RepID=UPI003EE9C055
MEKEELINSAIEAYKVKNFEFQMFLNGIKDFFQLHPELNTEGFPIVHSVKYRLKDPNHLKDKISRKWDEENPITEKNIFERVTDLAGVRVLHLYQNQFPLIHQKIIEKVNSKDWILAEEPKAYTWDPESIGFFKALDIKCEQKESYYTSIHYLVKPQKGSPLTCEIQVRTLFEEIWAEIDHSINYPHTTDSIPCKEQLRVLAKLVSTGTRLADSIFYCFDDFQKK